MLAFLAGWERSTDRSLDKGNSDSPQYASAKPASELRARCVESAKSAQVVGNFAGLDIGASIGDNNRITCLAACGAAVTIATPQAA
jgi:hypothetical protein